MKLCGTGHRPPKLGGYGPDVYSRLVDLADRWLDHGTDVTEVISGGALGWDQALAEAALRNKLPLVMALPFPGFEDRWPAASKTHLHSLMHRASKVVFVCDPGYAGRKMQERNEWMVDRADVVLALWDGSTGGTGNCVRYANKVGKPVENLWSEWVK